jgi:hypothetical protein
MKRRGHDNFPATGIHTNAATLLVGSDVSADPPDSELDPVTGCIALVYIAAGSNDRVRVTEVARQGERGNHTRTEAVAHWSCRGGSKGGDLPKPNALAT